MPGTSAGVPQGSPLKVVVVGAGPAGLLLAHYLLHYGNGRFRVLLFDKGEDPRQTVLKPPSSRRFSIGLNVRAHGCFSAVPRLAEKVMASVLHIDSMCMLLGWSSTPFSLPANLDEQGKKGGVVDRTLLCATLLEALVEWYQCTCTPPAAAAAAPAAADSATGERLAAAAPADAEEREAATESMPEALRDRGCSLYSANALLEIHFRATCVGVELGGQVATFEVLPDGEGRAVGGERGERTTEESYDLLVGADGLRSAVRFAFQQQERNFEVEQRDLFGEWAVEHFPCPPGFTKGTMHLVSKVPRTPGVSIFGLPSPDGSLCFLWTWNYTSTPTEWLACKTAEEAHEYIHSRVPHFNIPKEAAWRLLQQPLQRSMHVKCWRYHDSKGHAVLIGDAAHATPPSIGQGCNASLTDASVLARLLLGEKVTEDTRVPEGRSLQSEACEGRGKPGAGVREPLLGKSGETAEDVAELRRTVEEIRDALPSLLARYSALQVKEGHALVELSMGGSPFSPWMQLWEGVAFFLRQLLASIFPWFVLPPVLVLAASTTMPYSRIYSRFKHNVQTVVASNDEIRRKWYAQQAWKWERETMDA